MKNIFFIFLFALSLKGGAQNADAQFKENYSKGIEYYNKGVDILNNLQPNENIMHLDEIHVDAQKEFKEAMPFLEKAHSANPNDKNTIIALMGVYFSIRDMATYDKYKKELESLKK